MRCTQAVILALLSGVWAACGSDSSIDGDGADDVLEEPTLNADPALGLPYNGEEDAEFTSDEDEDAADNLEHSYLQGVFKPNVNVRLMPPRPAPQLPLHEATIRALLQRQLVRLGQQQ